MRVPCRVVMLAVVLLLTVPALSAADVKTEEKGLVKFEGALGRITGLFGGKAAREGVTTQNALRGDRLMTVTEQTGRIIDLAEEKVYELDMRRKTYRVVTFDELRRQWQDAQRKAEEDARRARQSEGAEPASDEPQKELEVDFSAKETGQRKTISGFDCREVVMTITIREKGKTLEQGGGMVLTSSSWLTSRIDAMAEVEHFRTRFAEKIYGSAGMASAEQMTMALAMYPALKQALGRLEAENVNLDGTAIFTVATIDAVKSAQQVAAEQRSEPESSSGSGIGGALGGLGRRIGRRRSEGESRQGARSTFMTTEHQVLKVSTDVSPADVAIPTGFTERK